MGVVHDLKQEKNVPVVIANHHGLITYVNPVFENVFEWKLTEIKDKPIAIIIPSRFHDAHNLGFSRFLSTGQPTLLGTPLELSAVTKKGKEFNAIHTIFAEQIEDQWIFGATISPTDKGN
ncbi:PAS domain S-box protein [Legionella wadsworthii]|uniref:PAS domain S-box protein n=1 Tax=Legionella wadsworthii TaxID=28088 RepID=A0A378P348_9GAMM|nr:PAS domain-containing protein [Legionella wadsworthii]STY78967.1 PAS domain S-box protein [Legionella wadsworthii]